jgi:hypothetical protein
MEMQAFFCLILTTESHGVDTKLTRSDTVSIEIT